MRRRLRCGKDRAADIPSERDCDSLLNFSRTSPTEFVSIDLNKTLRETLALLSIS